MVGIVDGGRGDADIKRAADRAPHRLEQLAERAGLSGAQVHDVGQRRPARDLFDQLGDCGDHGADVGDVTRAVQATEHLDAINRQAGPAPWKLSFSYGRALQDEAMEAWQGKSENLAAAQRAFHHRARCTSAAALGRYAGAMESEAASI